MFTTSGTTGRPKGAVITHRALSANVTQLLPGFQIQRGDRYLIVAPLYHAAASIAAFLAVACGATLVLQEDFVPADVVRALSEEGIGFTTLVPAMIQACLVAVPDVAQRRYASLRQIAYGASPISEPTLCRAMEAWIAHFLKLDVAIRPIRRIEEPRWAWHVGLDAESTAILNELWAGSEVEQGRMQRLLALFELRFEDPQSMRRDLAGRSVYLALSADAEGAVRMKPQNLLLNLPLAAAT